MLHEIIEHFAFDPSCIFHPDHDPGQNRFKNRGRSKIIGGSYLFQVIQNSVTIFRAVDTESSDIGLSDRKNIVADPGHRQIGQHFLIRTEMVKICRASRCLDQIVLR